MILYIETNFLMSIAKGQDPDANTLLESTPQSVCIAIPGICYVEALSTWETEKKYNQKFELELDKQISEASRNLASPQTKSLIYHLQQSKMEHEALTNDIEVRLKGSIEKTLERANIIQLNEDIIQEISENFLHNPPTLTIKKDLLDNLILRCILNDARLHPREVKVFLSANTKDFGKTAVQEALRDAGINNYFSSTQNFLGWLQSQ